MMKRFISVFLTAIMLLCLFPAAVFAGNAGEIAVVSAEENTKIVTPEAPSGVQIYAAEVLCDYIERITGMRLEITASDFSGGRKIYIGERAEKNVKAHGLPDGSYVLREKNGDLYIVGSGQRGNIYGVYGFLEKYCSCRWYTKDIKIIPTADGIFVPKNLDYTYKPYFEYTYTDWAGAIDPEFALAHSLSGVGSLSDKQGGAVRYISGFSHTLTREFCSAEKYFDSHPEYFALHGGKRTPNQLCLTNPDVLKIVTDEVLALAGKKHDPTQALQIISLTQHDNSDFCECESCKKLDKKNGAHSGTMLTFVNAVAEKVREEGFDNIAIDTFAYRYTRKPPAAVVPADNVIVRLCSIECGFNRPLTDPKCKKNAEFMRDFDDWCKICGRIYIWDYTANFRETANIFPNFRVMQANVQSFYESGARGIFEEGLSKNTVFTEFGELKTYLLAKLMQDPYMDYDAAADEFLRVFYGAGWENIREYIDFICEKAEDRFLGIEQDSKKTLRQMSRQDIEYCDALWKNAESAAQNEVFLKRMQRSELSWRYWKCSGSRGEFSRLQPCGRWMRAQKEFYDDVAAFGIPKLVGWVSSELTDCASLYLLRPSGVWNKKNESKFLRWLEPFVWCFYNFVS